MKSTSSMIAACLSPLVCSLALGFFSAAQAQTQTQTQTYTPFTQRSEPSFQYTGTVFSQPIAVKTVRLKNVDLHFEKSVAEKMMLVERGPRAWTSFGQSKLFDCSVISESLKKAEILNQSWVQPLKGSILRSCQFAENPELIFVKNRLVDLPFLGFSDVSSMTEFLLTGLYLQSMPLVFGGPEEARALQAALFKMKYSDIKSHWNESQKALESALSKTNSGSLEERVLKELRQNHQNLFGRIMELNALSKKQYARDHQKVLEQGRLRDPLPYDNLTDFDRRVLTGYLSGAFWRLRGGGLVDKPSGTQATRYHFTQVVMNRLAELNGGAEAVRHGEEHFKNLIFQKGWGVWMDMGRTPGEGSEAHDLFFMTQRGVDQVASLVNLMALARFESDPILVSGLQMGICYLFSWERLGSLKLAESARPPFAPFMDGPTAWGEWCLGTALGHGMSEAFLKGR